MIPVLDELEYFLYILEFILIILAIVIAVHAVAVMLWSYSETGDLLLYLRNFYHNVYSIDF
ncbi:hypothetical protein [Methanobrevibacter sp.]|uniref:hypothetical protein n=1 Tax=Methanobrevibacter sp. TaxID=66852 RepID=UPI0038678CF6